MAMLARGFDVRREGLFRSVGNGCKLFLCLALLNALRGSWEPLWGAEPASPPNIVLIISDDQGWGDFGFLGHPHIRTPRLDQLANESLVYRRGYVTSSLCCPSLAAVLTGKYGHQTKVTGNEPPRPRGLSGGNAYRDPDFLNQVQEMNSMILKHPRLPAVLGQAGYTSLQTGKWWAGSFKTGGFTHGMSHGDQAKGGRHGDDGLDIGRKTMQPVFDFIDGAQGKPFFLWYAPMLPHQPHNPPERILRNYREQTPSLHLARYWAMCEWFDETCGQILDHLEQKKLAENTIVVFMVDNGWIQEPDRGGYRADSKQSQYDGGLRTPIMIRWPGKVEHRFDDHPVSSVDIAPTLYRACRVAVPEDLTGVDLLNSKQVQSREAVFGACFLHNAVDIHAPEKNWTYRWCVAGDWKLILPNPDNVKEPRRPGRGVSPELYEVASDPTEDRNRFDERKDIANGLRRRIDEWWDGKSH